jgi:hypothetical protein
VLAIFLRADDRVAILVFHALVDAAARQTILKIRMEEKGRERIGKDILA